MLPVSLPDGRIQTVEADSAMTASEMCHKISALLGLKDQFGFAIYISIMDKVSYVNYYVKHHYLIINQIRYSNNLFFPSS